MIEVMSLLQYKEKLYETNINDKATGTYMFQWHHHLYYLTKILISSYGYIRVVHTPTLI